ncbi:MAG TPA: site-2 protease family protein [Solirubrobacterales bacterium]|nr:site-2 protease family protein [Solirubrobacterales bacterium]
MSWVLAISGFALLVVLHEAGHFTAAKAVGMRVERFFLFFPPKLVSIRRGETEYGVGAIPLGGFVKITGMNPEEEIPPEVAHRAYYRQPVWKRIVVIAAGPLVNIVLALVLFFVLALGFGLDSGPTNTVGTVSSDLPAAEVLEPGDELIAIDGRRVAGLPPAKLAETVRDEVAKHRCAGEPTDGCVATTAASLRVIRDGEPITVDVKPVYDAPEEVPGQPAVEPRMVIGFSYEPKRIDVSPGEAASFAADRLWWVTSQTATVFSRIFDPEVRDQISGVVGATEVTRQSFEFDARQAIGVLAVISLSLGLINLLPFLPLDGGHIFWAVVEKIRGRPVPLRIMERSGIVGFALVLILFAIGLENDIGRLTGEGFNVR